ncbi:MAG TPA: sporulation initiation factor Spo0A C-terminal domain-containing protein [Ruminiclostridium sp.]|nr:sporulation initiation factor Spo0A C-terminal domain-containing protein [Ruminiclostridium sp.]
MQVIVNERDKTVTMALEDFYHHFTSNQSQENPVLMNVTEVKPTADLEAEVTNLLGLIGMPRNIKGFNFTRQAIILAVKNPDIMERVTKELYPVIAKKFGTISSRAERAIRHAIEVTWERGNITAINHIFGYTVESSKGKATNSEFIALLADHLRLQMKTLGGNEIGSDM